jgi:hypothetical protein
MNSIRPQVLKRRNILVFLNFIALRAGYLSALNR